MRTIVFRDLKDDQVLDLVDPSIPYILITGFRPHSAREWWTTDIHLDKIEKIENVEVRDFTVDIMTDKRTVEKIFKLGRFNQLALWQFSNRVPSTLKIDELPSQTANKILIQNGLVNRIWINHEFVELSSVDEKYMQVIGDRYKHHLA